MAVLAPCVEDVGSSDRSLRFTDFGFTGAFIELSELSRSSLLLAVSAERSGIIKGVDFPLSEPRSRSLFQINSWRFPVLLFLFRSFPEMIGSIEPVLFMSFSPGHGAALSFYSKLRLENTPCDLEYPLEVLFLPSLVSLSLSAFC